MKRFRSAARQRGWGSAGYVAVLAGLMAVWRGAQAAVSLIAEYHSEFSWTLTIPF